VSDSVLPGDGRLAGHPRSFQGEVQHTASSVKKSPSGRHSFRERLEDLGRVIFRISTDRARNGTTLDRRGDRSLAIEGYLVRQRPSKSGGLMESQRSAAHRLVILGGRSIHEVNTASNRCALTPRYHGRAFLVERLLTPIDERAESSYPCNNAVGRY
jgi:hypothetical protein